MRNFILGTDWCTDCDDVVALRILTRMVKDKKINLKAIVINNCFDLSAASVDGFLTLDGLNNISIGIDLKAKNLKSDRQTYQIKLSKYASRYKSNKDAEDAVSLYRRILAEATEPIEIIEIGFLQAAAALLESPADEISDKTGLELVKEKVSKFWIMAGKWDVDGGIEYNFAANERAKYGAFVLCKKCPVPITFLGFEVGVDVYTGGSILNTDDHLYTAMCDHGSENGRSSWDPMTALLAVIGDEEKAGYKTVSGTASVDPDTGANHFEVSSSGLHKYIIKKYADSYYKEQINSIIK